MSNSLRLRSLLVMGASAAAMLAAGSPAFAQGGPVIEELVVTAQKREEAIQDVPIAVSAFDQEALEKQKIDGGPNLVLAVPNVNFSKGNFTTYNFQIRGIGSKAVAASGDAGTGVHLNNAPLIANSLFEAEFYDVERVEVLRGPQGTLYGRNATGGVVNVITAKPSDVFEGSVRAEVGNFNTRKLRGMINIPATDALSIRAAATMTKRDGYGTNTVTGNDVDGRDLWAGRLTIALEPTDDLRAMAMWEHFEEDDTRARIGKQLCAKDPGPTAVGGVTISGVAASVTRGFLSKGCLATSLYDPASLGTINTIPTLAGIFTIVTGTMSGDANAGKMQNPDLRVIESARDPVYRADQDVLMFNLEMDITDNLTLSSLSSMNQGTLFTLQDYNRVTPSVPFNITALTPAAAGFTGGVYNDPQVGRTDRLRVYDISAADFDSFSSELRLQSFYEGPLNFNLGGLVLRHSVTTDYYVMSNSLTLSSMTSNGFIGANTPIPGRIIDPSPLPTGEGHNYYDNRSPYRLQSAAVFGELYWQATETLKFTAGLRYNSDVKIQTQLPAQLTVAGYGSFPAGVLRSEFKETTGRIGFDWKPTLGFTNETLLYAFYSRGYKPGGLNPPCSAGIGCPPTTFAPELVDAYEIGVKNTLLEGSLVFNATAFYYNYEGYQISKIQNRTSVNENIDAKISGAEFETIWEPVENLRFNANLGLLSTEIQGGSSVDVFNRTQGDPTLTLLGGVFAGSNCVVPTAQLAAIITVIQSGIGPVPAYPAAGSVPPTFLIVGCRGDYRTGGPGSTNPLAPFGIRLDPTDGVAVNLAGKELPNSPKYTVSLGAQYTWDLGPWEAVLRGDYYRQAESYARFFNTLPDQIDGWDNTNLTFTVNNDESGLQFEAYVKNAFDDIPITDVYLTDDSSGLFRNIFTLEPRTYGVSVTKRW